MFLARRFGRSLFATYSKVVELESKTIVDPYFYENKSWIAKIQNFFINRSVLNDIERSFRDFKRKNAPHRYLTHYNNIITFMEKGKVDDLESLIAPTLFKVRLLPTQ
jgi:hypothetical protein